MQNILQQITKDVIGIFGFLLSIGGMLFCAYYSITTIIKIVRIKFTQTSQIGALPSEGQVEIIGKAEDKTINSPVAKKACVWWRIEVEKRGYMRDVGTYWSTIYTETSTEPFYVNDSTGRVMILPDKNIDVILNSGRGRSFENGLRKWHISHSTKILDEFGIKPTNFLGMKRKLRVIETVIEPGEQLYVLGKVKFENGVKRIGSKFGAPLIIGFNSQERPLQMISFRLFIAMLFFMVFLFMIPMVLTR